MQEIFVTVTPSKEFGALVNRLLKKRCRASRHFKLFAALALGYAVWSELNRREQNEKIEQLASKVEELGCDKEE